MLSAVIFLLRVITIHAPEFLLWVNLCWRLHWPNHRILDQLTNYQQREKKRRSSTTNSNYLLLRTRRVRWTNVHGLAAGSAQPTLAACVRQCFCNCCRSCSGRRWQAHYHPSIGRSSGEAVRSRLKIYFCNESFALVLLGVIKSPRLYTKRCNSLYCYIVYIPSLRLSPKEGRRQWTCTISPWFYYCVIRK